ncbi:MAG: hypothetical protein ACRDIB_07820, partial [Ardenticatenaceae bacterium]
MRQNPPHSTHRDLTSAVLATLAVALGLFSFFWARRHPEFAWDGPILLLAASLLLLYALRRGAAVPQRATRARPTQPLPAGPQLGPGWLSLAQVSRWRIVVFAVSVLLVFVLLRNLASPPLATYNR